MSSNHSESEQDDSEINDSDNEAENNEREEEPDDGNDSEDSSDPEEGIPSAPYRFKWRILRFDFLSNLSPFTKTKFIKVKQKCKKVSFYFKFIPNFNNGIKIDVEAKINYKTSISMYGKIYLLKGNKKFCLQGLTNCNFNFCKIIDDCFTSQVRKMLTSMSTIECTLIVPKATPKVMHIYEKINC